MLEELERLKQLVMDNGWDEESKQHVLGLEKNLHRLTVAEKLSEHPVMAEYMAYLRSQIAQCKEMLSEDEKLTEPERTKLFEKIKQSREFLGRFDLSQKAQLEKTIKDLLNVAKEA